MAPLSPVRRFALVAFALAILAIAATVSVIAGSRNGLVSYINAFTWLRWIAVGTTALIGPAVLVWLVSMRLPDTRATVYSGVATLALFALSGTLIANRAEPPPGPFINDITTDLDDPPRFEAVIPLRPASSTPVEYGGAETAANQRQVHPDIGPIHTQLAPPAAFARALALARDMGWNIVAADSSRGIIEAVDTTTFFRFKDDVVIRVRPADKGSRVDLRSHSREGLTDLGKNAERITEYRAAFSGS
jgi:uncharacterized protein (DUF1499 family)